MKSYLTLSRISNFFFTFLVIFVSSAIFVHAQGAMSISGDEICGASATGECSVKHLGIVFKNILSVVIMLGLPLLVVSVTYRFVMAWFAATEGNTAAYKEATKKSASAVIGFFLIVALFGGLMFVVLKYLGVRSDNGFDPLQIFNIFSQAFIPHAYAATPSPPVYTPLPNYLTSNNLYDLLLSILRLIIRFFIYPALIVIWVWTGFAFVFAQGKPDALKKAKSFFVKAFVTTLIIFLLQGFLIAVQGTVMKILPGKTLPTNGESILPGDGNGTGDGRLPPKDGQYGARCKTDTGGEGTIGSDGKCYSGRGGSYNIPCNTRNGGTCRQNGVDGMCQDYICVLPWTDPCTEIKQVNVSCKTRDNSEGTCLFDVNTSQFLCQVKK